MQSRRQLITAQAALAVAIAVTAVITFVVVRARWRARAPRITSSQVTSSCATACAGLRSS